LTSVPLWPALAWLGTGRPFHLDDLTEPSLAASLGGARLPRARTVRRGLARPAAGDVRAAVEAAYRAELPRRAGRVWAALDAHRVPHRGRGKPARVATGWSGSHGRSPRGYRPALAAATDAGRVIPFPLARGRACRCQADRRPARRTESRPPYADVGAVAWRRRLSLSR
jgi:hypothetical protein